MEQVRLLVLPFAGGNSYSFSKMKKLLAPHIEFKAVELPGRASRMNEHLLLSIPELVDDIYKTIRSFPRGDYAIFGHCIGALLAFLVSRKAAELDDTLPLQLIVSGCRPPAILKQAPLTDLTEAGLKKRMLQLGISADLLNHQDFYDMLAPVMKADFTAFGSYKYEMAKQLAIPVTVIMEKESRFTKEEALQWQEESEFPVSVVQLDKELGASYPTLAEIINSVIKPVNSMV